MSFNELQNCPSCKSENTTVSKIVTLLEGVRYDVVSCDDCGTQWKFYYKIADAQVEVIQSGAPVHTHIPAPANAPAPASAAAHAHSHAHECSCGHNHCGEKTADPKKK